MSVRHNISITLTVLGCRTPYPKPDQPCSGYLLRAGATVVWVDAGPGTFAELQRHVRLADIDAIWISHLHPDHCADLLSAWNAYVNTPSLPSPTVFGPPGWRERVEAMLGQDRAIERVFIAQELHDGDLAPIGPVELSAWQVEHSVPTFGLRAQHRDRVFAYSADSGPCSRLADMAQKAHVLVIEAGANTPQPHHCTPEEAGDIATDSHVSSVILTHVAPDLAPQHALKRLQTRFAGPADIARPGLTIPV
ncbi:MBL fold metallo-hydrolase [Sphaerisporangium sp. NPDC051017]|uniref:MBL fold metallo-hydrolase n=1 Tax=Sphaerisporangium sp. NPDC051017 TaxID=3154636 RepID=UPI003446CF31